MNCKIAIIIFVTLSSLGQLRAQSNVQYKLGVKGGINFSRFIERDVRNSFLGSYMIGASVEQSFSHNNSLSYDILYSRQGNNVFLVNPGIYKQLRSRYNYLTFSTSVRHQLVKVPLILVAGLQVGYLLTNKVDLLPLSGNPVFASEVKKIDPAFLVGLGYRINRHIFFELKYNQSYLSLIKADGEVLNGAVDISNRRYNQVINANITYYFN